MNAGLVVLAVEQQLPEDVGKSGPLGLLLTVVLLVAVLLLGRSMGKHLKRVPRSFDPEQPAVVVPDDASELFEPRAGEELLETLRRQPLAIEPPRRTDPDEGPTAAS
ncbi:hypothetical protein [Klenkia taihuensis]|uniref:Uncharacterized protein n=1 Tax=Klenkia taihuensis TaxID=1225127 RepID=A0A1I1MN55_9ACTN|nr:hypothetical protein [Klenkia taihuensis]GHE12608.1 hypothetical protein GCM10011381_31270 [Klenkia taihuensis]SFC86907.1 hypothetical protein SAMN05661030_1758 [Klenkia taihuensis]